MAEALAIVAQAFGALYVVAALLAVYKLRLDWFLDKALAQLTLKPTGDRPILLAITGFAVLYGIAGVGLLLRSSWSIYVLGAGLALQALFFAWRRAVDKQELASSTVNAAGLSLLAFIVAVLAWRSGTIS